MDFSKQVDGLLESHRLDEAADLVRKISMEYLDMKQDQQNIEAQFMSKYADYTKNLKYINCSADEMEEHVYRAQY